VEDPSGAGLDLAAHLNADLSGSQLSRRARASWRRARAVELALAGHDYDTIAVEVGFSHRASAWRAVDQALTERVADNADHYRALTLARLEELLASHWTAATHHGDTKAADLVLKVVAQQIKLLGLDQAGQVAEQVQTVVVAGTSEEYIAALQRVVAGSVP
jgi:hypothetical protein